MKLYTRTTCGQCRIAKTLMDGKGLNYEVVNVDFDEAARKVLEEQGFQTAPVLELNGEFYPMPQLMGQVHMLGEA